MTARTMLCAVFAAASVWRERGGICRTCLERPADMDMAAGVESDAGAPPRHGAAVGQARVHGGELRVFDKVELTPC